MSIERTHFLPNFPLSPVERQSWPWEKYCLLPERMSDGSAWPKISIITPSYNQGEYIEETIRSVLLQGYPNLEYIIMDGGSSDQTVEIIKKYEKWIDYWVSEPDKGQSHAINKGFQRATGDLVVWLNSDDLLVENALLSVVRAFVPNSNVLILGDVINFEDSSDREVLIKQAHITLKNFIGMSQDGFSWHQPGTFVSRECLKHGGNLDESLHYAFDWDWMCKMLIHKPDIFYLAQPVARFRLHNESKTGGNMPDFRRETIKVIQRYFGTGLNMKERRLALSFYYFKLTELYLSVHDNKYWDRSLGLKSLCVSAYYHISVVKNELFYKLLLRVFLPRCFFGKK